MLITADEIRYVLKEHQIPITGVLHVGAHDCEELGIYETLGISPEKIIWIDAMDTKVKQAADRGIPNVYHAVISDSDDADVIFHVANNGQSSSILEMGTHAAEYPDISYVGCIIQKSTTLTSFFKTHSIDPASISLWNFDIQGAELLALQGGATLLPHVTAIYLEVNQAELYKGCGKIGEVDQFLMTHGFKRVITRMTGHGWGDALYVREANNA